MRGKEGVGLPRAAKGLQLSYQLLEFRMPPIVLSDTQSRSTECIGWILNPTASPHPALINYPDLRSKTSNQKTATHWKIWGHLSLSKRTRREHSILRSPGIFFAIYWRVSVKVTSSFPRHKGQTDLMTPKTSAVVLRIGHATTGSCVLTAHAVCRTTHGQTSGERGGDFRDASCEIRMSGRGGRLATQ